MCLVEWHSKQREPGRTWHACEAMQFCMLGLHNLKQGRRVMGDSER